MTDDNVIESVLTEVKPDLVKVNTVTNLIKLVSDKMYEFTKTAEDCTDPIPLLKEILTKESEVYAK